MRRQLYGFCTEAILHENTTAFVLPTLQYLREENVQNPPGSDHFVGGRHDSTAKRAHIRVAVAAPKAERSLVETADQSIPKIGHLLAKEIGRLLINDLNAELHVQVVAQAVLLENWYIDDLQFYVFMLDRRRMIGLILFLFGVFLNGLSELLTRFTGRILLDRTKVI